MMKYLAIAVFTLACLFLATLAGHDARKRHSRLLGQCIHQGGNMLVHNVYNSDLDICINTNNVIFVDRRD